MRVGVLQFASELRCLDKNISRADELLEDIRPGQLDLLVLPELAFTGYNFPSLSAIQPYLEPTANGPTAEWARRTAVRLGCLVSVGYPETYTPSEAAADLAIISKNSFPISRRSGNPPRQYNAMVTVSPSGSVVAHYRKTNLYYTDATWAWPNPDGFETIPLPLPSSTSSYSLDGFLAAQSSFSSPPLSTSSSNDAIPTAFGICMDFNPRHFTAPWTDYEIATHLKRTNARLLIASNAWLTHASREELTRHPSEPDQQTLSYWIARLAPLIHEHVDKDDSQSRSSAVPPSTKPDPSKGGGCERIIVIANRTGIEPGAVRACDLTVGHPPLVSSPSPDPSISDLSSTTTTTSRTSLPPEPLPNPSLDPSSAIQSESGTSAAASVEPTTAAPAEGARDSAALLEEGMVDAEARYAGSSCVLGLRGDGVVRVYGLMGRAEEGVLVVDTDDEPRWLAEFGAD